MTYAVVARCPRSAHFGIAIASYSIAIGLYCDGALRAHTGATLTQGCPNPRNNYLALNLLAQGHAAAHALGELLANDPDGDYRQIAVVDREDRVAAHTGTRLRAWSGHVTGSGYAAFGDMLAGPQVLDALAKAYEAASRADLDERLLQALTAAGGAGGMSGARGRLPERSAALIVWGDRPHNELDIRVDLHEQAVQELQRIYVDYKPTIAYYEERARSPRNATPPMEFAETLKAERERRA